MGLAMLIKKSHLNADQQEVADIIGLENYQALIDMYGGDRLYIPKARSIVPATIRRPPSARTSRPNREQRLPKSFRPPARISGR